MIGYVGSRDYVGAPQSPHSEDPTSILTSHWKTETDPLVASSVRVANMWICVGLLRRLRGPFVNPRPGVPLHILPTPPLLLAGYVARKGVVLAWKCSKNGKNCKINEIIRKNNDQEIRFLHDLHILTFRAPPRSLFSKNKKTNGQPTARHVW